LYPVTTEIPRSDPAYDSAISRFYEDSAATLASLLDGGRTVAVISEGDPLFYGSYMHLHVRLSPRYTTEIIPGVTAMSGCWSEVGIPIAQGDDVFIVLPATLPEDELERHLAQSNVAVVMKIGRHLEKVRRALGRSGKLARAIYVERATTDRAVSMPLASKRNDTAPYFSIVLVPH
jgi:precorrin-2/cobalt-factor-2 C20-methyltransferase